MNFNKALLFGVVSVLLATSQAIAQAPSVSDAILKLTFVDPTGRALVEYPDGTRIMPEEGMVLPEGARVFVMEKGEVHAEPVNGRRCRIKVQSNTTIRVSRMAACHIAVETGKQITSRNVVQVAARQASQQRLPGIVLTADTTGGLNPMYVVGGIAGAAVLAVAVSDDDDSSTTPVSP